MSDFLFLHPERLWALGAVAIVAILYLFYRRYKPLPVTGLFLWGSPRREGLGGRRVEKPLLGRSLLLDLLAAAFLALALAGLSVHVGGGPPMAIILDDSFSMRARGGRDKAVAAARDLLRRAGRSGTPAAVLTAGERPLVLAGPGMPVAEAVSTVENDYLPSAAVTDPGKAVALARDLYGPDLEIRLVTNREHDAAAWNDVTAHVVAGRGGNLALYRAWRLAGDADGAETIEIAVRSFGDAAVEADIIVDAADAVGEGTAFRRQIAVDAGASADLSLVIRGMEDETLLVRVEASSEADVIAEDSLAYLPPNPRRAFSYALDGIDGGGARYYRLALEAAGCVPHVPSDGGEAPDLLLTADPEKRGRALTVEIPAADDPGVFLPPYTVDRRQPLCRDVNLTDVAWVVASRAPAERVAAPFIMAGNTPLYWRSAPDRLHLNLDAGRCRIVHSPAWPALVHNLAAEALRLVPGLARSGYRPGETLRYRMAAGQGGARLTTAAGATVRVLAPGRETELPANAGLYRIVDVDGVTAEVSVLPFHGNASDVRGAASEDRILRPSPDMTAEAGGIMDLTWLALVLGMAFLCVNWHLGRRE